MENPGDEGMPPQRWTRAIQYQDRWADPADDPPESVAGPVANDERSTVLD